jgi:protein FAM32A
MPASDYTASSGALKLKGSGGITKKKRKKSKPSTSSAEPSSSTALSKSAVIDQEEPTASITLDKQPSREEELGGSSKDVAEPKSGAAKTEAEIRFEENRRRRMEERLKKEGGKTHKERVEELNRYLSRLSEHHDMCVIIVISISLLC